MNESAARHTVFLQAWETAADTTPPWTEEDRAWASRAAAEVEGEAAPADIWLARRAALGVERIVARDPALARILRAATWRAWPGWLLAGLAFAAGFAVDAAGAGHRINILAPPVLAVLAWNLVVYAALIATALASGLMSGPRRHPGIVGRLISQFGFGSAPARARRTAGSATAVFLATWFTASLPLTGARAAKVLHIAAALFALGLLAGLYVRGVAFEYLAGWDSTFLDAGTVHRLLAFVLHPASVVTGLALPDAAHLAAIRFSAGPGENAARWIHLHAVTVLILVVAPRLALAAIARWRESRLANHFPIPVDDVYFRRLVRAHREEPAAVHVVPYGTQPTPSGTLALHAAFTRVFGARTEVAIAPATAFGAEDDPGSIAQPPEGAELVVALFALTATPEHENHGAFLRALKQATAGQSPLIAVVDEAAFNRRFGDGGTRAGERRDAWRRLLAACDTPGAFVDLEATPPGTLETAIADAVDQTGTRSRSR